MTSTQRLVQDVEHFYRSYIEAFNHQDIDRYAQCFSIPYCFVRGVGLMVCTDAAELKTLCAQTFKGLKSRGWDHSEARQIKVWPLEDDHAMILADVTRLKADNSALEHGRFCYTARNDGRDWKILTISPVAEPFLGPGDHPR